MIWWSISLLTKYSNPLADLLRGFLDDSKEAEQDRRQRVGRLKAELTEAEGAIQKLLDMVEKGLMDMDDPALVERLHQHKTNRVRLSDEIALASRSVSTGPLAITPQKLERLSVVMREALKSGPVEFRRAHLRRFVHRAVVSRREVRISGPKSALAKAAISDQPPPGPEVLSLVQQWRPVRDSNPCYQRERLVS
jgi:site-specific DNA recombinase